MIFNSIIIAILCSSLSVNNAVQPNIFSVTSQLAVQLLVFGSNYQLVSAKSADALMDEAKKYISQGKHNEALQTLEAAVSVNEDDYLIRFKRAIVFIGMGRNGNALSDLDFILKQKPDFEQALLQRAKIYLRQCELENAIKDLETINSKSSSDEAKSLLKDASEALENYKKARKLDEEGSKNYDDIIESLNQVTLVCSQNGDIRMMKAEYYEKKGEIVLAIGEYTRASVLKSDNIPAYLKLTSLHLKLGEVELALNNVKGCLHLDPEHRQCSKQFKKLKKITKAMQKAEDAMKRFKFRDALGPDALDSDFKGQNGVMSLLKELEIEGVVKKKSLNLICECYTKLKRWTDALKWCSDAAKIEGNDDVETFCNLGDAQLQKEEYEQAVETFKKAHEMPGGQQSNRVREGHQKAQRLLRQSKKKDYYKILGVSRDANDREIKKAFRKLAREYHPDKFNGDKVTAEKKMAEINQAYEVLSNEELKKRYDAGDDPNDPTGGQEGGFPFGQNVFFQGGGFPFGGGGQFEFRF